MQCINNSRMKCLLYTFIETLSLAIVLSDNPYDILGIEKYATAQDIRKTYKHLARIWHPDKNEHPEATKVFVKMKQAYELLSDAERRRMFDQYGVYNTKFHSPAPKSYVLKNQASSDRFENFFGKQFIFDNDISFFHKMSITMNNFEMKLVPRSKNTPCILIFYNDWCFRCMRLIDTFKKLIETLERLGIYVAAVNSAHEQLLVKRTGVIDIPSLIVVLEGYSYIYRGNISKLAMVEEFIRKKIPHTVAKKIYDENVDLFLGGWIDNRVRALFFQPRNRTRLRYLISAYNFYHRVAFGFVQLNNTKTGLVQNRYGVDPMLDTLLIFNEDIGRPLEMISMPEIPVQTLNKIISLNQYLMLPRLSSQQVMEDICPAGWNQLQKCLCVILITENSNSYNYAYTAFKTIARQTEYSMKKVRFAYMFKEKQSTFIHSIAKGFTNNQDSQIVIIWRRNGTYIKYEFIKSSLLAMDTKAHFKSEYAVNATRLHVTNSIHRLLKSSEEFSFEALVQNLEDEHAQTIIDRWFSKLKYVCEYLIENLETEHILAILSLAGTIFFMIGVGYIMVYFVRAEEKNLKVSGHLEGNGKLMIQTRSTQELKLHELRAEKYNGMVRLLNPGCRTIILVTDFKTRSKLIPLFHKAVWPYRKSKTLLFGHMLIEKGLVWYSELLKLSLNESTTLNINPRNCVGTVIALNGHRKYFCMYHAKHPETNRDKKSLAKFTKNTFKDVSDAEISTLVGVEPIHLLEENLLDGLSNWLDRLFEGSTHRYYINYWPEFPMK
ncbi:dnaJ homolog subfamily C member 16 isoform X1 [Eurosta solidaginis]|uniref:dnaJ homolog subfamily C member 16 isoform X1 n=1 Tax=Eurosta solidaginis TaxID=178769 RepID=UPI003530FD18